jgi:hypothetical protein
MRTGQQAAICSNYGFQPVNLTGEYSPKLPAR